MPTVSPAPASPACLRRTRSAVRLLLAAGCLAALACGGAGSGEGDAPPAAAAARVGAMDAVAEAYVKLVLALGRHDPGYVDAYYGPAEWQQEAETAARPLAEIGTAAEAQIAVLDAEPEPTGRLERLRRRFLARQLAALAARVDLLGGRRLSFDEESRALYDAVAPSHGPEHFAAVLAELERRLPGEGPLVDRYAAWRQDFVIPAERLDRVFEAAIEACRERTRQHVDLPAGESFSVEYVTDQPWSGYNWYQGGYRSLIQVNTDLPVYIDRALDLACHEGYPGHHVYNALLEKHLVRGRGWVEFSVYPLYSPQSLIAEGTANFGIEVAFPGAARTAFEREVLFPLAGVDPARADEYAEVRARVEALTYAGNEAARRYLDGELDAAEAAAWLERYALMPAARAAQRIRFIDRYRSYVINYNLGQDLVRRWVESRGGGAEEPTRRWEIFAELLSTPRLPSGLAAEIGAAAAGSVAASDPGPSAAAESGGTAPGGG